MSKSDIQINKFLQTVKKTTISGTYIVVSYRKTCNIRVLHNVQCHHESVMRPQCITRGTVTVCPINVVQ